ncbi:DMT family transporter [Plantactinospora sp. CA-290183]|uniref:DMT family transporter n=1 Tax=Plantactinospora sp. CA-290183 TaxID=3240006 RepID=UPI003D8A17F7
MNLAAILLSLAAAALFAIGSALEQTSTKQEKATRTLDPRLLLRLVRRPRWILGWFPALIGTILQALALRVGPLVLVEPLLLAGVFMAVPITAAMNRQRPHARDLLVVVLGAAGLVAFLVAAAPRAGLNQAPTAAWLPILAGLAAAFTLFLVLAWRIEGAARGILLGAGTGLLYGVAAALVKTVTVQAGQGLGTLFTNWHLYVLLAVSLAGLVLNQNAFQSGPIAAPLTTITLLDPLTSIVLGVGVYRETLSLGGFRLVVIVLAALLMGYALWLARRTRSG